MLDRVRLSLRHVEMKLQSNKRQCFKYSSSVIRAKSNKKGSASERASEEEEGVSNEFGQEKAVVRVFSFERRLFTRKLLQAIDARTCLICNHRV